MGCLVTKIKVKALVKRTVEKWPKKLLGKAMEIAEEAGQFHVFCTFSNIF